MVHDALAHPALVAARARTSQGGRVERWLRTRSVLHSQSGEGTAVERRRGLSREEFFECYYFRNRPVIVEGWLGDWPALTRWTLDGLHSRFGDAPVEVMDGRDAEPSPDLHAERLRRTVPFGEFVARMRGGPTNDVYLVARNSLFQREPFRALLSDVRAPAGIIHPEVSAPECAHLWFGPAGTLSNLHHDHLSVLFCQVVGRKRVWLVPSWETPRLANGQGLYSEVDIEAPDVERFPEFARATLSTCEVGPGDALLLPVGWWHAVRALDVSVSVTFVNFDVPRRNTYWRDYWLGPVPAEVRR
ncbi:cupin-like domain-containing protein [Myxococcaceae bacterium JPH2]|nr:cupin-like domain-containing protein [Myxococcaceae bacterium JPH2]